MQCVLICAADVGLANPIAAINKAKVDIVIRSSVKWRSGSRGGCACDIGGGKRRWHGRVGSSNFRCIWGQ